MVIGVVVAMLLSQTIVEGGKVTISWSSQFRAGGAGDEVTIGTLPSVTVASVAFVASVVPESVVLPLPVLEVGITDDTVAFTMPVDGKSG
jgi:hypothetical protein